MRKKYNFIGRYSLPGMISMLYMLILTACEVMGLDLESGEIRNYSQRPDEYDEPEGIFPDGKHILMEWAGVFLFMI